MSPQTRDFTTADTMHLSPSSNAHTLYGDMLLYYLRYYTNPNPTHCL